MAGHEIYTRIAPVYNEGDLRSPKRVDVSYSL